MSRGNIKPSRWEQWLAPDSGGRVVRILPVRALTLDERMRQVLAELELVSHGTTAKWNTAGGGENDALLPPGEPDPPHLFYRDRYQVAEGDDQRTRVLDAAIEALEGHRKSRRIEVQEETASEFNRRARRLIADGWTVEEVALHTRSTPTRVRRALAAKDDESDGVIHRLHAEGRSVRYIAMRTGIAKSTVHRILRQAA